MDADIAPDGQNNHDTSMFDLPVRLIFHVLVCSIYPNAIAAVNMALGTVFYLVPEVSAPALSSLRCGLDAHRHFYPLYLSYSIHGHVDSP